MWLCEQPHLGNVTRRVRVTRDELSQTRRTENEIKRSQLSFNHVGLPDIVLIRLSLHSLSTLPLPPTIPGLGPLPYP